MKKSVLVTVTAIAASLLIAPENAYSGPGKALAKATVARIFKKDLQNHTKAKVKPLAKPLTVHRYTSLAQASREARVGLAANTHMTATARRGRPLSAATAQRRYGLPRRPEVRETIRLPNGHPVRRNRVVAGQPSYGEKSSPKALPPSTIKRVIFLK